MDPTWPATTMPPQRPPRPSSAQRFDAHDLALGKHQPQSSATKGQILDIDKGTIDRTISKDATGDAKAKGYELLARFDKNVQWQEPHASQDENFSPSLDGTHPNPVAPSGPVPPQDSLNSAHLYSGQTMFPEPVASPELPSPPRRVAPPGPVAPPGLDPTPQPMLSPDLVHPHQPVFSTVPSILPPVPSFSPPARYHAPPGQNPPRRAVPSELYNFEPSLVDVRASKYLPAPVLPGQQPPGEIELYPTPAPSDSFNYPRASSLGPRSDHPFRPGPALRNTPPSPPRTSSTITGTDDSSFRAQPDVANLVPHDYQTQQQLSEQYKRKKLLKKRQVEQMDMGRINTAQAGGVSPTVQPTIGQIQNHPAPPLRNPHQIKGHWGSESKHAQRVATAALQQQNFFSPSQPRPRIFQSENDRVSKPAAQLSGLEKSILDRTTSRPVLQTRNELRRSFIPKRVVSFPPEKHGQESELSQIITTYHTPATQRSLSKANCDRADEISASIGQAFDSTPYFSRPVHAAPLQQRWSGSLLDSDGRSTTSEKEQIVRLPSKKAPKHCGEQLDDPLLSTTERFHRYNRTALQAQWQSDGKLDQLNAKHQKKTTNFPKVQKRPPNRPLSWTKP
ncbi:hypothetical protein EV356DRAFT_271473 [Viridothelium virens]|uniref:Uncharacterized protein n=1 Tax=Viridothelium virens TaxID=1048519 RepID=A0A6A6H349_VIRVR|nr:hypothetical protein EV356DRAFT_271473 [Viridothelium virens]